MKRTHLPLNALRVFDAAARHLSFTKAADELAVTPAAVGQQIRALEDVLGVVLFRRLTRNLELTPEAERALPALRAGFLQFEESVRVLRDWQGSKTLTLAASRALTARWLLPRLGRYREANPGLGLVLLAADEMEGRDGIPDFTQANLDLAVVFGPAPSDPDLKHQSLGPETLVAVAAPGAITEADAAEDGRAPPASRIRYGRDAAQESGSTPAGVSEHPDSEPLCQVDDAGLAIEAALAGCGVARVPARLVQAELASGRLVQLGPAEPLEVGYRLVAPSPQWRQAKVRALVAFLSS